MPKPNNKNALQRQILWLVVPGLLAGLAAFWLAPNPFRMSAAQQDEDGRTLIEAKESLYNNIYIYADGDIRSMTFGYNRAIYTESKYNTRDELDLPVAYTRYMTASLMYAGQLTSILEIGSGGGRTAWYLHRYLPNAMITSVELDPEIVKLAHKYFGIKDEPNFKIVNKDGRLFLSSSKDKYDIILIDAYRGPFVPFHLLTKEFYQLVKDHLAEGGVVAQNIEPTTMLFNSSAKTIASVFPNEDFYVMPANVVTIAYPDPKRSKANLKQTAAERQKELNLRYSLSEMLSKRRSSGPETIDKSAKILTDDFAPVETLKAVAAHNRKWVEK